MKAFNALKQYFDPNLFDYRFRLEKYQQDREINYSVQKIKTLNKIISRFGFWCLTKKEAIKLAKILYKQQQKGNL